MRPLLGTLVEIRAGGPESRVNDGIAAAGGPDLDVLRGAFGTCRDNPRRLVFDEARRRS